MIAVASRRALPNGMVLVAGGSNNSDGYVAGAGELMPLYLAAARDFGQPLFAYGPPRLVRLGVEFAF